MAKRIRTVEPDRSQVVMRWEVSDDALPLDHPARVLWLLTGTMDLSRFLVDAKVVQGGVGRSALSPRVKLTLWLYGISQGIGSAREIARRVQQDVAFRWLVGDLAVSHHTLSSFRAAQGQAFDELLTDILASLLHKGVLSLDVVAQDGMRVRANASAPSFRRLPSLQACREQAALHLKAVMAQAKDPELTQAQKARREAAARDFQKRVEAAVSTVEQLQQARNAPPEPRASTTDAQARVMKMADGGFRPGYNIQMATAGSAQGGPRTVVGVQVTNIGSDMSAVTPMLDDIQRRTGQLPQTLLADANHSGYQGIREATARGVTALIAVPQYAKAPTSRHAQRDPAIVAWRERMASEEAKQLYRARASLCELLNAHLRRYGLQQLLVRGLTKVTNVAFLVAITFNLLQHARTLLT